ncbi:MarR family transcriptional regulator [Lentilactobacillus senioris]|uniref:MarR family winged helix-turn-helix transcriptional regulator n=1 Tax=Lentilactobacillus senioris TaxID=931534 RepID=UPI002283142A|nr:MarR family transcriptional regulator [Lentilactobacillus senioris]MCY9806663.1 MarR family transcriptional regulator [Lentilactobacillus senioris]
MVEILRSLGNIARALDSISNIEFKAYELTKGQYLYLVRICEQPGIISEELSTMLKVDRSTVARAIKKLEANGLVERRSSVDNKKNKRIFATERGLAIYPVIKAENDYSNQVALAGLSEVEAQQLKQLLSRVETNVNGDWELVKKGGTRGYLK